MDDVRTKYEGLIRSRNKHELAMLRDEIEMALIRIKRESNENMGPVEGKRY